MLLITTVVKAFAEPVPCKSMESLTGPDKAITACQLHMRSFKDGDTIYIEPWRAKAFPVIKDLIVDRSAFDRIQQAGGIYISEYFRKHPGCQCDSDSKDGC